MPSTAPCGPAAAAAADSCSSYIRSAARHSILLDTEEEEEYRHRRPAAATIVVVHRAAAAFQGHLITRRSNNNNMLRRTLRHKCHSVHLLSTVPSPGPSTGPQWQSNAQKPASARVELQLTQRDWHHQADMMIRAAAAASPAAALPSATSSTRSPPALDRHPRVGAQAAVDATAETCIKLCETGHLAEAVDTLHLLVQTGCRVSTSLFYTVLKGCCAQRNLMLGRQVHALALRSGYQSNTFLANHIIRMYAAHGRLEDAIDVFNGVAVPDAFMWSSLISAHTQLAEPKQAVALYQRMRSSSFSSSLKPDAHVFVAALKACTSAGDLDSGIQVHADVLAQGLLLQRNVFVGSCLVEMYAKCGKVDAARKVFDNLSTRDVVTWNSMIHAYADHGRGREALALYAQLEQEGLLLADRVTFLCLVKACASVGSLQQGRQLHSHMAQRGLTAHLVIANCLVDMYAKCGSVEDARRVFEGLVVRDVVTWNSMINAYTEQGLGEEALALYASMLQQEGCDDALPAAPNSVTFACLVKACTRVGCLRQGRQLHSEILERGGRQMMATSSVLGNCLIDMYAKCGSLDDAREVFDSMPDSVRDVVTWTAMMVAYVDHGQGQAALALYAEMQQQGGMVSANKTTYACLLKACGSTGALQQGKRLHAEIVDKKVEVDTAVGSCLVDMYAKCGSVDDARRVFAGLPERTVISWTAMVHGYGQTNDGPRAVQCFEEMLRVGVPPDGTSFLCLLVACSHAGLVDEGRRYFGAMERDHGIVPTRQHYACMVDLLGRAGRLDEAEQMLMLLLSSESGDDGDLVGWMALLSACKSHKDVERGRRCFESVTRVDPQNASAYVLMANIYAEAGRWADVDRIQLLRKTAGAAKKPAQAGIEVDNRVHTFVVGENKGDMSCKLRALNRRWKEGGHVPHTLLVLKNPAASERQKEDELCGHAEKLALAYGLLHTPDGAPLLVTKNLRMCGDCHSSTKVMSRVEKRQIIVRDAHRVHRFVEGACSCGDRP